jgi:crotonobetainyl-CoA:carnitine CoA-transferase CaiB-like acyl-CoA transferase
MEEKLFEGLKVVELASVLAGPAVGMFFAELGAEVMKIENKRTGGDVTRQWKSKTEPTEATVSAYYSSVNFNKTTLLLDLRESDELNQVYRLVKEADIVISNFKKGDDTKLGLDYNRLKQIKPNLIYAHLIGFASAPNRTAYDAVIQAETGFMSMNGSEESGPLKFPVAIMDLFAAHQMKEGILAALWKREKTGKGAKVEVTLEESGIASLVNQASNYLMNDSVPGLSGSLHPNIAPYGETFKCKDGKPVVLAIGNNFHFEKMCRLLKATQIAENPNYSDNQNRLKNRPQLAEELKAAFAKMNRTEIMDAMIAENVPVGAIKTLEEVFAEQTAKDMILESEMEGRKTRRVSGVGFRLS